MALPKITVEIQLTQNIVDYTLDAPNASAYSNIPTLKTKSIGDIPFILGCSPLNGGDVFKDAGYKYPGYYSKTLSNASGVVSDELQFIGFGLTYISIIFDKVADQFATSFEFDGVLYGNNSSDEILIKLESTQYHTIKILKWNKPLYPPRITSVTQPVFLVYEEEYIKDITTSDEFTSNNEKPAFGITGQYGKIQLIDKDLTIARMAERYALSSGMPVYVYLNKTTSINEEVQTPTSSALKNYFNNTRANRLCALFVDKWDYNYGVDIVSIEIKDLTESFKKKNMPMLSVVSGGSEGDGVPLGLIYLVIVSGNGFDFGSIESSFVDWMAYGNSTHVHTLFVDNSNAYDRIKIFCEATCSYYYITPQGGGLLRRLD